MKKMLSLVLGAIITAGFVGPTLSLANEQLEPQTEASVSTTESSQDTFEHFKNFVDSKISFDGSKYVLNNPSEIRELLIKNETQISLEINSDFSAEAYFDSITKNIEDMNAKLANGGYHVVSDNGIEKNKISARQAAPEKPYQMTSHWWGLKIQSFGPKGTEDIKSLVKKSEQLSGLVSIVTGIKATEILAVFPAFSFLEDKWIITEIETLIAKKEHTKGIQVDVNSWVPHYAVYKN